MIIDTERYHFISSALKGDGGFMPRVIISGDGTPQTAGTSHLVPYPRESSVKLARRNQVAWYENHLLPACQRFVGYLVKKPPLRETPHPLLQDFADDCNWRGDSLDVFWQGFMIAAKARGMMFLIVDMPASAPGNYADQIDMRYFPYLVSVAPERVEAVSVDFRGRVSRFEYRDTDDEGVSVIRGWDAKQWWVRQGDKVVDDDDHPLGECPVLLFSEDGEFPCVGQFAQIADLSKRLFNARSELDEILRAQTFSLLTYQVPPEQAHTFDAKATSEAIGTHNMLIHSGSEPAFIAPPDGPAATYLETIAHIEQAISRVSLAVELPAQQSAESGLALTIRFQNLNASLTSFARRMEDLERNVWWLASRWLGLQAVGVVEWAKDYALADMSAELRTLADMIATGMPSDALTAQKRGIVQLAFPTMPDDDMQALISSIDEGGQEINNQEIDQLLASTATGKPQ